MAVHNNVPLRRGCARPLPKTVTAISQLDIDSMWKWNPEIPPVQACIHSLIEKMARVQPDAAAIESSDGYLTYEQLDSHATNLAHNLVSRGVRPGSVVAICLDKSAWAPVACLAIMKAGATCVALDVSQPEKLLRQITAQAGATTTLASAARAKLAKKILHDGLVLILGDELLQCPSPLTSRDQVLPKIAATSIAYKVYESTCDEPLEGIVVSHQNITSAVAYQRGALEVTSSSKILAYGPVEHRISWLAMLHTLANGGCLCIPSDEEESKDISLCLHKYSPTTAFLTPAAARFIGPTNLSNLSTLIIVTEEAHTSNIHLAGNSSCTKFAYMPRGMSQVVSIQCLEAYRAQIGRGLGVSTWVIDVNDHDELSQIGTVGELYIEGPLVGVDNHLPKKSGKQFPGKIVKNPSWLLRGANGYPGRQGRLHRTGDLVRNNDDGSLEYIGRKEELISGRNRRASLSQEDLRTIWAWNTAVPKPVEVCVHNLFQSVARLHPNRVAVCAWDGSLTYGILDSLSTKLAYELLDAGIGRGMVVPLCFEKSVKMSVAMIAVMKTGAAAVGIDPKQPVPRLRNIITQARAQFILSSTSMEGLSRSLGQCRVLAVDLEDLYQRPIAVSSRLPNVDPSEVLYIVFTSGSTGTPKGVVITHRNYSSAATHQWHPSGHSTSTRVLDFASYAFDASWYNVLHALTSGGCLCVPSEAELQNDLTGCFEKYDITMALLTPSVTRHLDLSNFTQLDTLILGGEKVLPNDIPKTSASTTVKIMYGPSECTPVTTIHDTSATGTTSIGRGCGVCTWVVNPDQPSLSPIGEVGELWLEGPLVGPGYLYEVEKTAKSFIQDPRWLVQGGSDNPGRQGRLFRTGDLVKYNNDGTLAYMGRKDTQVKVRGQRVELEEVEQHVQAALQATKFGCGHPRVIAETIHPEGTNGMILIAFVSLQNAEKQVEGDHANSVRLAANQIMDGLVATLPSYMVPSAFIPMTKIPMTITGKTDRIQLRNIGEHSWQEHRIQLEELAAAEPATDMERVLREVWMSVLNLSAEVVAVNTGFTNLGGDSITAMHVVSGCRSRNIAVTVTDILQAGTIQKLAPRCQMIRSASIPEPNFMDETTSPFELAPMQSKYFDIAGDAINLLTQTFVLKLKQHIPEETIHAALLAVATRHQQLRTCYQINQHGKWEQFIASEGVDSFAFARHDLFDHGEMAGIVQHRQATFNVQNGPLFAGDLFQTGSGSQTLVLSAHNLVVDAMSWHIIRDSVQEYIQYGSWYSQEPLSFRTWCKRQNDSVRMAEPDSVLPFAVPKADFDFWAVKPAGNTHELSESFVEVLDHEITSSLLGRSNDPLRTEALDIIVAAYAYSFRQAFPERSMPAVFLESHGREISESASLDALDTVGCFSNIYPVSVGATSDNTILETVRIAKDIRNRIPNGGGSYFASRYNSSACREKFVAHDDIELLLSFRGGSDQLVDDDGLFSHSSSQDGHLAPWCATVKRIALIETALVVQQGRLVATLTVNRQMRYQGRLGRWFRNFIQVMKYAVHSLQFTPSAFTLSDIPLLPLTYNGLDKLLKIQLPKLELAAEEVIDIFPCLPLQEGILLSSSSGVSSYATYSIWTCVSNDGSQPVSPSKLEAAWRVVASRHTILSVLIDVHPEDSGFIQIVHSDPRTFVSHMAIPAGNPSVALRHVDPPTFANNTPQHVFTICQSSTETACRLDINHVLIDGVSLSLLTSELIAAYDGYTLQPAPSYSNLIRHIAAIPKESNVAFWAKFLDGVRPCEIPTSFSAPAHSLTETIRYLTLPNASTVGILNFCKYTGITRAVFLQVAWAMMLSHFTGMEDVCFGNLASGRNAPVDGVEHVVGPLASMLIGRINLAHTPASVLKTVSQNSMEQLDYQHTSLAAIQHAIGHTTRRLFNTAISVEEADQFEGNLDNTISLDLTDQQGSHEFDLLLSSSIGVDSTIVTVQCREATISNQFAHEIVAVLNGAINYLIDTAGRQFSTGYAASQPSTLNCGSLYGDFFRHITGTDENEALSFWRDEFEGLDATALPPTKCTTDDGKPQTEARFELGNLDLTGDIFTTEAKLRAAWAIVAAKNENSSQSLFGAAVSRGQACSIIPVRVIVDWNGTGSALLQSVQNTITKMTTFQHAGLHVIRRASEDANLACNIATKVILDLGSVNGQAEPGILQPPDSQSMTVRCQTRGNELLLGMKYDAAAVSELRVKRLASQFEQAIRCLNDFNMRKSQLHDMVTISPQELEDIWTWNSPVPKAAETPVHELIKERVLLTPEAPAICAWDGNLTYGSLDALSEKLAHHLVSLGIGPEMIVPLCFEKSMWMPVAALAVMKAGAASLALDTTLPEVRLQTIVRQVDRKVILASAAMTSLGNRLGAGKVITVSAELQQINDNSQNRKLPTTHPSNLLYVVFTSGSTGTPKGTMITHENFSTSIVYQQAELGLTPSSRVYDFASYAFDVAWGNVLHALTCGGCLCIPSEADRQNNIERSIMSLQANYAHITPTIMRHVDWYKLRSTITVINLSGEPVLSTDRARIPEDIKLVNAYGPAETNVATVQDLGTLGEREVSIGRGAGVCTWVVDVEDPKSLSSIGRDGELWLEGPLVGRGYLHDDARTSAVFVEDPPWLLQGTATRPGRRGRLYRTGDLVRYCEDGSLLYMGRKDTQVKIRGQRVELGEVELQVQRALDKMGQGIGPLDIVAETVQPQETDKVMLVAFLSLHGNAAMTDEDLKVAVQQATAGLSDILATQLPRYMVPEAYIPIRELPVTATGKVDRQELRRIGASVTVQEIVALAQVSSSRPWFKTPTERVMQQLWADILGIAPDSISADANFFRVGGDSMGAMRLVSKARDRQLSFTVRDVFQHPTLKDLSTLAFANDSPRRALSVCQVSA